MAVAHLPAVQLASAVSLLAFDSARRFTMAVGLGAAACRGPRGLAASPALHALLQELLQVGRQLVLLLCHASFCQCWLPTHCFNIIHDAHRTRARQQQTVTYLSRRAKQRRCCWHTCSSGDKPRPHLCEPQRPAVSAAVLLRCAAATNLRQTGQESSVLLCCAVMWLNIDMQLCDASLALFRADGAG